MTTTTHNAVVIDEDPYNQLMDEEDKMMKPAGNEMPAADVCSPQFKSGVSEIDGDAASDLIDEDDGNEVTTEEASTTEIFEWLMPTTVSKKKVTYIVDEVCGDQEGGVQQVPLH